MTAMQNYHLLEINENVKKDCFLIYALFTLMILCDIFVSPIFQIWTKSFYPHKVLSVDIISNCVWQSIIFGDEGLNIIAEMIELHHYFFKCVHFYSCHQIGT